MMKPELLREKLNDLPLKPGVYLMKDVAGKVIYIGKAKVLRHRVRSYFLDSRSIDAKTEALREKIADFELLVTDNEIEALILEANLIKRHHPRYNVNLKDDKRYPYLKVTRDDSFPRLTITRLVKPDGGIYFGPYANVSAMRETHKMLNRLFKLRTCKLTIPHPKGREQKVCLEYHLKLCPGPCEKLISPQEYGKSVQKVIKFLQGKTAGLRDELQSEMQALARRQEYEEAAEVRDQIAAIEAVMEKQKVVAEKAVDRDIIAFARSGGDLSVVVLQIREGLLIGRQNLYLKTDRHENESAIAASFIQQYYLRTSDVPDEIYCSYPAEEEVLIREWLREKRGSKVELTFPRKGEKLKLVGMAETNARLLLSELIAHRKESAGQLPQSLAALQKELYLQRAPVTICAFDISNLGSTNAVGSMVFFKNGKPLKKNYRHFKIKTVKGQDDFAMMQEVVARYFSRVQQGEEEMPDFCLIDGGRGQLNAALQALATLGIEDLQICGLAKRLEEIVLPGDSKMLSLPHTSPALKLLQRVRDEAHRFAVTYHRKLRSQKATTSVLDTIAGIGTKRKQELLKTFGSLEGLRAASVEEIKKVVKNQKVAESIIETLRRQ